VSQLKPPPHKIIREVLRHYLEFEALAVEQDPLNEYISDYTLTYGEYSISFLDLQGCLKKLSPRKQEAVFYNVILDWKQAQVADLMGIKTVTVGQYVEQACEQIEEHLLRKQNPPEAEAA
jgi:DNA-directed RNA polymerase specialized sigma24 family protein